jgi:hypothetical protein
MAFMPLSVAALLVLSATSSVEALCRVRFELQPETSVLSYSGTSKLQQQGSSLQPLTSPVSEDKTVAKGVQGAIFLTSNDTKAVCPKTASGWLAALPSYTLTSSIPFFDSPLSIWPYMLPGKTAGFTYNASNIVSFSCLLWWRHAGKRGEVHA